MRHIKVELSIPIWTTVKYANYTETHPTTDQSE